MTPVYAPCSMCLKCYSGNCKECPAHQAEMAEFNRDTIHELFVAMLRRSGSSSGRQGKQAPAEATIHSRTTRVESFFVETIYHHSPEFHAHSNIQGSRQPINKNDKGLRFLIF